MEIFLNILIIAFALSIDSFVLALSYGVSRAKISLSSALLISVICAVTVLFSLFVGNFLAGLIPADITTAISFVVLLALGLVKLFQKQSASAVKRLNIRESVMLGLTMSVDGLVAGIGIGLFMNEILLVFAAVFCFSILSVLFGNWLGNLLSRSLRFDVSRLGGVIIIALAFLKLR